MRDLSVSSFSARSISVVVDLCAPFKVCRRTVRRVLVLVIHLRKTIWIWKERNCDKSVYRASPSLVPKRDMDCRIRYRAECWLEDPSSVRTDAGDSPKITHLVKTVRSVYVLPFLFHSVCSPSESMSYPGMSRCTARARTLRADPFRLRRTPPLICRTYAFILSPESRSLTSRARFSMCTRFRRATRHC